MANTVYTVFYSSLASGTINWGSDTFVVALLGSTYTPNRQHVAWSEVSVHEIPEGGGYVRVSNPGHYVATTTINVNHALSRVELIMADPQWTGSISAAKAVILKYNPVTPASSTLVACIDWEATYTSLNSQFTVNIDSANGISNVLMTLEQLN